MAIKIDSTLEYLKFQLNLTDMKIQQYQGKTVEEILLAEAAQGNRAAVELAVKMFTNTEDLIELFQLTDPNNKLIIIMGMDPYQLEELLPMLETKDLQMGLQFFTKEQLLFFLEDIPMEELVKVAFEMFTPRQLMEKISEEELDKLLTGLYVDKGLVLKHLKDVPAIYLQQIVEGITGESANGTSAELSAQIGQFNDGDYKNAICLLRGEQKRNLTLAILTEQPKLFERFDPSAYTKLFRQEKDKPDIIKAMGVIKPEFLHKIISKLPQDLLSIVITQIDTHKFADALINKYPEILAKFIAG